MTTGRTCVGRNSLVPKLQRETKTNNGTNTRSSVQTPRREKVLTPTRLSSVATEEAMKTTAGDWVLANLDVVGYYRVNYDDSNWDKLLNALSTNHSVRHFWRMPSYKRVSWCFLSRELTETCCFSRIFKWSTELSWWMMLSTWPGESSWCYIEQRMKAKAEHVYF